MRNALGMYWKMMRNQRAVFMSAVAEPPRFGIMAQAINCMDRLRDYESVSRF